MTDELLILLEQQHAHLQSLQIVMKNEELLLGYQRVPPSPFQETTEQKRFLVAAIGHGETHRLQLESQAEITAPYEGNTELASVWEAIKVLTTSLKELNYRNHQMLQLHIELNAQRLNFVKKHNNQSTYGADGLESKRPVLGKKISI
ncbi:flagella synthesis protein FlgN [Providencia huaxiensis]|uniref:flagella synthesis protein FlgN n=1 Tax=Providencia TaxID=586 RepID=UPI000EE9578E|nr:MULTISPECIES: flagellar export chaperone FlgN [Providencia]HCI95572.1 flagellar biosynthesis protein FlgN [Providencia sp.]ELR5057934.1 flagellar export chaperone FlgN [Providencia rettgeri]ELR5085394.1 flagellar export chaperone FlgN [Providencia rettgeri]ELR5108544.1 flagellar export chaperone FlgN [Providencia rettgeri]ELR5284740.1 flagellar export chaperone FlgN [Providencia rettgeri]